MNLIGYLRVSTDEQVRNGAGLEIQRQQIANWCAARQHTIVGWCQDEGVSGSIASRPGLMEVYDFLEQDFIDGVVAQAETRYGRSLEVQEAFFARVWELDKRVLTVEVGEIRQDDPDDPMRTAMRRMRGVMAELEAGLIRKRMRDGKAAARAARKYQGGPCPYGWRAVGGAYVPFEPEQEVLRKVRELRDQGLTDYKVIQTLNKLGMKTTNGSNWQYRSFRRLLEPGQHPLDRHLPKEHSPT